MPLSDAQLIALDRIASGPLGEMKIIVSPKNDAWQIEFYQRCTEKRFVAVIKLLKEMHYERPA